MFNGKHDDIPVELGGFSPNSSNKQHLETNATHHETNQPPVLCFQLPVAMSQNPGT
jgi:hypothetical protein